MIATEIVAAILLGICILGNLLSSVGLVVRRNAYDQIHYLAPASIVGAICITAAILLHEGWTQSSAKAIATAVLLLLANPVLSHATARACRIRREDSLLPAEKEANGG